MENEKKKSRRFWLAALLLALMVLGFVGMVLGFMLGVGAGIERGMREMGATERSPVERVPAAKRVWG